MQYRFHLTYLRATAALLVVAAVAWLSAGSLTPPAGPVAPTMKTLSEVEPRIAINAVNTPGIASAVFRIAQPGSYYLTGPVTGMPGKHGIIVAASEVSIDLMGFTLEGVPGSVNGITTDSPRANLAVRSGVVRSWGASGVSLDTDNKAGGTIIEAVQAVSNGGVGISCGAGSIIRACTAVSNSGYGIQTRDNCVVESCTARANATFGIITGNWSVVRGCSVQDTVGQGIVTGASATITGCVASGNSISGISADPGSTITQCSCSYNSGDGISAGSGCIILANTCDHNGVGAPSAAGIHVLLSDNRIESNNVTNNDRGIDVDMGGNLVIRNSARGNTTDYDIVGPNTVGPTVTSANIATSNNPHANYGF